MCIRDRDKASVTQYIAYYTDYNARKSEICNFSGSILRICHKQFESASFKGLFNFINFTDVKTRLISVNIRKDKDDHTQYTAKDGTVKEKHYGKISGDNVIDLENGQRCV